MEVWKRFRRYEGSNIIFVFVSVQLVCVIFATLFPYSFPYLSVSNLQTLFKSAPQLAIMSIGVGLLMIAGEFDLSVGSIFALTSYVMVMSYDAGLSGPLAALLALVAGAGMGAINGVIVIRTRIPSFIATLGTMMLWRGVILVVSNSETIPFRPLGIMEPLFNGQMGLADYQYVQAPFLWLILIGIGGFLLLERHRLGNHIYAVGGNREAAIAIGVNSNRVKMICFVVVGLLSALTGIISTMRVHSVSPLNGDGMELKCIAACVVGGLSLTGGIGSVVGICLGSILLFTIENVLLLRGINSSYVKIFVGILIILAVIFNNLTRKRKN